MRAQEIGLQQGVTGGCGRDVPCYIALWRAGPLPVERLLTGASLLSDINARMDELASGCAVRQIVLPYA